MILMDRIEPLDGPRDCPEMEMTDSLFFAHLLSFIYIYIYNLVFRVLNCMYALRLSCV